MPKSTHDSSGLSSIDVLRLQEHLEATHYGHIAIELRAVPNRYSGRGRFHVTVSCYVGAYRSPKNTRAAITVAFPHNDYKTLAGAMFGALHQLDSELEQLRAVPRGGLTPLEAALADTSSTTET